MIHIISYGEDAVLVNFEQKIDETISEKVLILKEKLSTVKGIRSLIPAYCSLTVVFNPRLFDHNKITTIIKSISFDEIESSAKHKKLIIPVCYEGDKGLDLKALANTLKLSTEELIDIHTSQAYRTFMIGFLPGFPYLGKTAEALHCKRLAKPRKHVKAGSVGLAGQQTGIYPIDAPGGWQIIGQTPLPLFQMQDGFKTLIKPGDQVSFRAIGEEEFHSIKEQVSSDNFNWEEING